MRPDYETVAEIIKEVGTELGLSLQTSPVIGSADKDTRQLLSYLKETVEELVYRFPFNTTIGTNPYVVTDQGAAGYKIQNDTDTIVLDARLLKLGTRWRYLHGKGLTYDEDFRSYQIRIMDLAYKYNIRRDIDTNVAGPVVIT